MTDIKAVHIEFIPHGFQRYDTVGDFWIDENLTLQIRMSDMKNTSYNCLVAIHEFVEWMLTDIRGLAEQDIMAFDKKNPDSDDPGFLFDAPYKREHTFATSIEMMICAFAGIDWKEYDQVVLGL